MSENFEFVLYYKKRVVIGGKASIDTMISVKEKFVPGLETEDYDAILDEYSRNKEPIGKEEIVTSWHLVIDDENFTKNVIKLENEDDFIKWEEKSNDIIKLTMAQ